MRPPLSGYKKIREDVMAELEWEPSIDAAAIGVALKKVW